MSKLKNLFSSRQWHNWVGIVLSLPIFIVGASAVFIAVEGIYKDKEYEPMVNVAWLPGYSQSAIEKEYAATRAEVRAFMAVNDSLAFYGNKFGLVANANNQLVPIEKLKGIEIHTLAMADNTLLAGTKGGLFAVNATTFDAQLLLKKDIHHITVSPNGHITACDNKAMYVADQPSGQWTKDTRFEALLDRQAAATSVDGIMEIPFHKFVMDLHTGKAFTGKAFESVWVFILGLSIAALSVTGIIVWLRRELKKRAAAKKVITKP